MGLKVCDLRMKSFPFSVFSGFIHMLFQELSAWTENFLT